MVRSTVVALAATVVVAGGLGVAQAVPAAAAQDGGHTPVTLCHAAGGSGTFTLVTVDAESVLQEGHSSHPGDIVPAFEHAAGTFPGQGLDALFGDAQVTGAQVLANGCVVPAVVEPSGPVEPTPEPAPVEPAPEPVPGEPTDPAPVEPTPTDPAATAPLVPEPAEEGWTAQVLASPGEQGATLAETGTPAAGLVALAAGTLAAGAGALALRRRLSHG
ncbi:hypothetical protein [Cellulomonas fimi]|uniref:LPXTG-motif cell wall anchor domain protein n=1 Tax=Cellulomonas fimi (strain ATCC 484 / DSM 20113 / JCM 1341 / CCUG 24087 / LMG 16345 / NBRC 15513 / NCIMB 8980 / NCTC 7547 / NRS-133) TaxID=590998 RepID=F4H0J9_CELFA|nr:hypothetical protein [Cellulomonas fimi]AEE47368.1 hypothetical protein Celf_3254 [Cellulomonas fimi ATCC 484]NNH05802.1 hypothetical protein [Cellulomonas fimi]VEH36039.1 Uncharacterised protein [Cellulomonas fimi]